MKLIGPEFTALYRKVERELVGALERLNFREIMLPRMIALDDWRRVASTLGPISDELDRELFRIVGKDDAQPTQALCHWQCEPFYVALAEPEGRSLPDRMFDRSGWSFRNEKDESDFRHQQFQRIECVMKGSDAVLAASFDGAFTALVGAVEHFIGPLDLYCPLAEVTGSPQLEVRDAVWRRPGLEVEIVGGHRHGGAFVERFLPGAANLQTACIGVSVSRIVAVLASGRAE